jgi:hypothetical protein
MMHSLGTDHFDHFDLNHPEDRTSAIFPGSPYSVCHSIPQTMFPSFFDYSPPPLRERFGAGFRESFAMNPFNLDMRME